MHARGEGLHERIAVDLHRRAPGVAAVGRFAERDAVAHAAREARVLPHHADLAVARDPELAEDRAVANRRAGLGIGCAQRQQVGHEDGGRPCGALVARADDPQRERAADVVHVGEQVDQRAVGQHLDAVADGLRHGARVIDDACRLPVHAVVGAAREQSGARAFARHGAQAVPHGVDVARIGGIGGE